MLTNLIASTLTLAAEEANPLQHVVNHFFFGIDQADGTKLWSYKTDNGVIAAPSTYEIDGEQYVALMVGYGGAGALSAPALLPERPRLPGRLMVFKLGGTAKAPPYEYSKLGYEHILKVCKASGLTIDHSRPS